MYLAHNQPPFPAALPENMRQTVGIERMEAGAAVLLDGRRVEVDVLLFCTGQWLDSGLSEAGVPREGWRGQAGWRVCCISELVRSRW